MDSFVNPFRGQVAPPAPVRRQRVRRFREQSLLGVFVFCTLLVVALPVGFVTARPLYVGVKHWRAERLALAAEGLANQQQWEAALTKASAAYLLAPDNARNARLVARVFTHFGSERALDFWQLAVSAEPGRQEDRRALVEGALSYQQNELAEIHAADLLKQAPNDRTNLLLAAKVARATRDYGRELKILQRAERIYPGDEEIRFLIDRVNVTVGSDFQVRRALAEMREQAERKDKVGLAALDFFMTRPADDFPDRERLANLLRFHPEAKGSHIVPAYAVEIDADPATRSVRLDQLVAEAGPGDAETKVAAADWLLRIGEYQRVLALLPWSTSKQVPQLALLHLDALSRLGDSAAVASALATPGLPLRKEFVQLCRWQAARSSKVGNASDREASAALEAATSFPPSLSFLAAHFEEAGRPDLALQAYSRLRHVQKFRTVALVGLLRLTRQEQDTKGLLRLLEQAKSEGLTDAAAQAELAYYQLLLHRNVRENRALLAKLASEHPERITFFSTLALACLTDGDASGALKSFEQCGFRWERANSSMRAVYAAALQAGGRSSEASEVLRGLPPDSLLPEERALVATVPAWAGKAPHEL